LEFERMVARLEELDFANVTREEEALQETLVALTNYGTSGAKPEAGESSDRVKSRRVRQPAQPLSPKVLKLEAVNWSAACIIDSMKHWNRVLDWAVVATLSLFIAAALIHAGGQLRAAGTSTQAQTVQR
jgi:hypothetical protein